MGAVRWVLYSELRSAKERLSLLADGTVASVDILEDFIAAVRLGASGVAGLKKFDASTLAWLQTLERSKSGSVVLVAPLTVASARWARALWNEEATVRWLEELPRAERGFSITLLESARSDLILELNRSTAGQPTLGRVLARLGQAGEPPPATVSELCRAAFASESVVRYHWNQVFDFGLKDVLSWMVLLAALLDAPDGHWDRIARDVRVHRRTLERLSRRLTGLPLAEAARRPDVVAHTLRVTFALDRRNRRTEVSHEDAG